MCALVNCNGEYFYDELRAMDYACIFIVFIVFQALKLPAEI